MHPVKSDLSLIPAAPFSKENSQCSDVEMERPQEINLKGTLLSIQVSLSGSCIGFIQSIMMRYKWSEGVGKFLAELLD